jgi:hypothetical protein
VSAVAGLGGSLSAQVRECVAGILGILAQHPGAKGSHKVQYINGGWHESIQYSISLRANFLSALGGHTHGICGEARITTEAVRVLCPSHISNVFLGHWWILLAHPQTSWS